MAAVAVPVVISTFAKFGVVFDKDRSWFVGPGPYRSTEYVEERPLWSESIARPFRAVDGWLGRRGIQLIFRWSAVVMFLWLGALGALWYFTGSRPQTEFTALSLTAVEHPATLLSLPRVLGVATLPLWVLVLVPGLMSLLRSEDRGLRNGLISIWATITALSAVYAGATAAFDVGFSLVGLTLGAVLVALGAVIAFCISFDQFHRLDTGLKDAVMIGFQDSGMISLFLVTAICLPFGFTHGFLYATALALILLWAIVCAVALAVIAGFVFTAIYEFIKRWLGRLWDAAKHVAGRIWHYLTVKDIPEEGSDDDTSSD